MRYFQKRNKLRKILFSRITLTVLIGLIFLALYQTWDVYSKYRGAGERLREAEQDFAKLEDRKAFLQDEIQELSTDAGVEEELRRTFGVAKEGEGVIILVDDPEEENAVRRDTESLWQRIKRWFE